MLLTEQAARLQGGDWAPFFAAECAKPYFAALDAFVTEAAAHTTVHPAAENIFAAFAACPAAGIRAVILGQDPYHEPEQAMGLSFSVPDACKAPPSLRNIFKELESETGTQRTHNDLTPWAQQSRAFAHAKQGWETFTKAALEYAVQQSVAPLAAVLWGKPAQKYAPVFAAVQDRRPVLVLESAHPSPLSAYRGFFGSAPFGKINAFLQQHGEAAIDWLK